MKILILIDRLDWAYHSIAEGLEKYNADKDVHIDYMPIKGGASKIRKVYKKYDRFLVMGYQTWGHVDFLPKKETFVGVHGHHAWDKHNTMPTKDIEPPQRLHDMLYSFRGVNVVSERLKRLFPYAVYTPNGVDLKVFKPTNKPGMRDRLIVGCAYNPKHDWRKGVKEYIEPAAQVANCGVLFAPKDKSHNEMPKYYNSIDIYVCASSSEGMSLALLEAMACGRPVISTIRNEVHGQKFVDRTVESIAHTLARWSIVPGLLVPYNEGVLREIQHYSWDKRVKGWVDFLKG